MTTVTVSTRGHEEELVRAFIRKDKQERCLFLLSRPARRRKFTSGLAHFDLRYLQHSYLIPPGNGDEEIILLLQRKGAGPTVWVISEDSEFDGSEVELGEAVRRVCGYDMGTFLSCIPGRLALFKSEESNSVRLLEIE